MRKSVNLLASSPLAQAVEWVVTLALCLTPAALYVLLETST